MNILYYHDFFGDDNVLNQFEILANTTLSSRQVEATSSPFVLDYQDVRKLEPIRGSQATIGLISESNFQFTNLHTDGMREYLVKFYRAGKIYWVGWLDSELYNEQLSAVPPYPVEFSAADFNIWERLKYRDEAGESYTGVVPLITHLKRCLDLLGLPFQKLFIGCSTVPEGIQPGNGETALHVLYIQSANFYDEDNEPMTCREVVESVLRPFGLMITQKDANVYIYDYNTVRRGLPMMRYDLRTFSYEGAETVNFNLGNLTEIGFASTDGDYGFEEMVNNVAITSSLYAEAELQKVDVGKDTLTDLIDKFENRVYTLTNYRTCENIENLEGKFSQYERFEEYIEGCHLSYAIDPPDLKPLYRVRIPAFLISSEAGHRLSVKMRAYASSRDVPFRDYEGMKGDDKESRVAKVIKLWANLYMTDSAGNVLSYYTLQWEIIEGRPEDDSQGPRWINSTDGNMEQGKFGLYFREKGSDVLIVDKWVENCNEHNFSPYPREWIFYVDGGGIDIPLKDTGGYLVLEILNRSRVCNTIDDNVSTDNVLAESFIKFLLINNIEIGVLDKDKKTINIDDFEFKSYVNKKVASDFEDITLKCISANEEKLPVGKGNILKKTGGHYELQLSYTRAGQTDILERLLMRTIHSNFATKNGKMSVSVRMTGNPSLSYVSCAPILPDNYLVTGCSLDFHSGVTAITAVGYSDDVANLSDIPYD